MKASFPIRKGTVSKLPYNKPTEKDEFHTFVLFLSKKLSYAMKKLAFFLCIVCMTTTVEAQEFIPLWEKGKMPNSRGLNLPDSIANERIYRVGGFIFLRPPEPKTKAPPSSSFRVEDMLGWPTKSADSNWPSGSIQWESRPLSCNIASRNRPMSRHVTRLLYKIYNVPCATYAPMPTAGA